MQKSIDMKNMTNYKICTLFCNKTRGKIGWLLKRKSKRDISGIKIGKNN